MEVRSHRVVIETGRHRITGSLALPPHGYRSRLSDFLNSGEVDFITLTDAHVELLDGGAATERADYLSVSRAQVVIAMPAPEAPGTPEPPQPPATPHPPEAPADQLP